MFNENEVKEAIAAHYTQKNNMFTESYIVRVYRRDTEDPRYLMGLVEIIETQEKKIFKNFDELREILNHDQVNMQKKRQTEYKP